MRRRNRPWEEPHPGVWISAPGTDKGFCRSASSANYRLVLIGQLYEKISLEDLLANCISYIEQNKDFDDPAGHYILFVINTLKPQTYVFTNRMGSYHAYWSSTGTISTNYTILSKSLNNTSLDWEGITGFFAMGYFPNDKTYLREVRIFEPASCYCFDNNLRLLSKNRYSTWQYNPQERPIDNTIEELHSILQDSLSVATQGYRVGLPISGGLDSRLLAGELTGKHIGYAGLQAFSYGYSGDSPETAIAKKVASACSVPLYSYTLPNYLFETLGEIADAVELFQYVDGTRQASAMSWLSDNTDLVVGGHWGDVWMNNMHVHDEQELLPAFRSKIIKKGSKWLLEEICKPNISRPVEYLDDYFLEFNNRYSYIKDADFQFKIYKTEQWSHRWTTASIRMYQAASFPVLPFYDRRISDLFSTIPVNIIKNRKLEIEYIKAFYPRLAKIRWQEYDANLYLFRTFNNRNLLYRTASKLRRVMKQQQTVQRNWEVFFLNPNGKKKLEEMLLNEPYLSEFVSREKVGLLLNDLQDKPAAGNGYTVSMLLTFSLFLKKIYNN